MKRNFWIGLAVVLILLIAGGFWLYNWVLADPLAASEPISAIPVEVDTQAPTNLPETTGPTAEETLPTDTPEGSVDPASSLSSDGMLILTILPDESEVRFNIDEVLNGQDKTVVGKTNQVAGEIAINPDDLSQVEFAPIQVNARTFVTDDDRRNNAIRNRILLTNEYEFITFTPTALVGLSGPGAVGQTYDFQVTGNLTIRDVTRPVTFDITLQAESDSRLSGIAIALIKRAVFEITIPSVPFVANVGDDISIELDLVFVPVSP